MENLEYKAELRDPTLARLIIQQGRSLYVGTFDQVDTYFHISDGRLKRRVCEGEPIEWILYHRSNQLEPRVSRFSIFSEEEARTRYGQALPAVRAVVRKRRQLWLHRAIRIHLDEVEGLGRFIELEAMVTPTHDHESCRESLARLMLKLAPAMGEPISDSYADMVERDEQDVVPHAEGRESSGEADGG